MGLLEDFNQQMEDTQTALHTSISAHGEALSTAFQIYFSSCQADLENFKQKMKSIHTSLHISLHGELIPVEEEEKETPKETPSPLPRTDALLRAISYLKEEPHQ